MIIFFLVRLLSSNTNMCLRVKHVSHEKPVLNSSTPFTLVTLTPNGNSQMEESNIPNILNYGIRVINIVFAPSAVQSQKYTKYINVSFTLILVVLAQNTEVLYVCFNKQTNKQTNRIQIQHGFFNFSSKDTPL